MFENLILIPCMCAFLGLPTGSIIGVFGSMGEWAQDQYNCKEWRKCQDWEKSKCALAEGGQYLYGTLARNNATALSLMDQIASQSGQASLKGEIDILASQCDWTRTNCPDFDKTGPGSCFAIENEYFKFVRKSVWVTTAVTGGIGVAMGVALQIYDCVKARRQQAAVTYNPV